MDLDRLIRKWSRGLAKFSELILLSICFISMTVTVCVLMRKFPDFTNTHAGFDVKNTELSAKIVSWNLLTSDEEGRFVDNPLEYYLHLHDKESTKNRRRKPNKHGNRHKHRKNNKMDNDVQQQHHHHRVQERSINEFTISSDNHFLNYTGDFFCDVPHESYSKIVITSKQEHLDLWTWENMLAQCYLDVKIRESSPYFSQNCVMTPYNDHLCCRSWSPANYIALLNNKTSCFDITEDDLKRFKDVVNICQHHYLKGHLVPDCRQDLECNQTVDEVCYRNNDIYNFFEYIVDYEFRFNATAKNSTYNVTLPTAMIMLPLAMRTENLDIYEDIVNNETLLGFQGIKISAMDLGAKETLFDSKLKADAFYIFFGMVFVVFCLWFYTRSIIITLGTSFSVVFSLGLSYFFYTYIFNIEFFPFMNLLTVVVIVGIGSDDTFIFFKFWETEKNNLAQPPDLGQLIIRTMKNAIPAMLVTTITTAGAFLASIVSQVTAIDCFSIFSGLTVVVNFFFMVTWLPACVVLAEKYELKKAVYPENAERPPSNQLYDRITEGFTNFLVGTIVTIKWFWFALFLIIGTGSFLVVFWRPALELPDTMDFQLFRSSQLFEQYELYYAKRFWFERKRVHTDAPLPLQFVWGIIPTDNTKRLDPNDRGRLVEDPSFNLSHPDSQLWLLNFCTQLKSQRFNLITPGWLPKNCYIEPLQTWMAKRCQDPVDEKKTYKPCCEVTLPYTPELFTLCSAVYAEEMSHASPHLYNFQARMAGPKFYRQNNTEITRIYKKDGAIAARTKAISEIRALIVEFNSNVPYSLSFAEVDRFYNEVDNWMKNMLKSAPPGMRNGWFVSDLKFYALQKVLQDGTYYAIIVALFISLIVLGYVTSDMALSLCALASIGGAILTTIAITVLIGWKLNVLESIAISTAIGLATDFSLHYSVGYRENPQVARVGRARCTIKHFGGPTLMAALTTGIAGAFMLPSEVLAYSQIGLFLVIVMSISWLYATFFLCSTLAIMGPTKFRRYFNSRTNLVEQDLQNEIAEQNGAIALNDVQPNEENNFHDVPLNPAHTNGSNTNDLGMDNISADEVGDGILANGGQERTAE